MAPDTPLYFSYTICTVLYYIYFICTVFVVFVPQFTTGVLPPYHCFILYLYHSFYFICTISVSQSTTGVLSTFHCRVSKLPVRLQIHQSVRWPLSPFLIRLVLLGSLTHCYPPFYLYFARGLLEVQRRHNVYRLL